MYIVIGEWDDEVGMTKCNTLEEARAVAARWENIHTDIAVYVTLVIEEEK